jgi:hypothetical protein
MEKKSLSICKGCAQFVSFYLSVTSFYGSKIHYGDFIDLENINLRFMMNNIFYGLGIAGFWLLLLSPVLFFKFEILL